MNGFSSFERIVKIVEDLSRLSPEQARESYKEFPLLAEYIARLFSGDHLYDILPRLERQLKIIERYDPPIRPAIDPYSSMQLGIFSKNFSDWEVGRFLHYPDCCIRSFSEDLRYGFDRKHLEEAKRLKEKVAFVSTAGFVPHSLFCREASERALIGFVEIEELPLLDEIEGELDRELPHTHPEYQKHYYDVLIQESKG